MAPAARSLSGTLSPPLWPGLFLFSSCLGGVGEWANFICRNGREATMQPSTCLVVGIVAVALVACDVGEKTNPWEQTWTSKSYKA